MVWIAISSTFSFLETRDEALTVSQDASLKLGNNVVLNIH